MKSSEVYDGHFEISYVQGGHLFIDVGRLIGTCKFGTRFRLNSQLFPSADINSNPKV